MHSLKQQWTRLGAGLLFLIPSLLSAAPVDGVFTYHQPDGSKLSVKVKGDEFFAEEMTLDGQRVVQDPVTKFWCYAKLSADGSELESTGIVASATSPRHFTSAESVPSYFRIKTPKDYRQRIDAANRTRLGRDHHGRFLHQAGEAMLPAAGAGTSAAAASVQPVSGNTLGTKRGLTLLIRFSDRAVDVTISRAQVDNYCNQTSSHYTEFGNNGSVAEFYADVSGGRLTYSNAVADYYTAKQVRSYYTDETVARAPELVVEGLNALEAAGFDFRTVDADGNGAIDALNVFYAGPVVNAWAKGLWPHASGLSWQSAKTGIRATGYQISDMDAALTLGTFCHENGHMLCGFPDVYDYDGDSAGGSGAFDLMDAGCFGGNPCAPNGYLRYKAGWGSAESLGTGVNASKNLTAESGGLLANQFLIYSNPTNGQEYYLIENRYKNDHDAGMPTGGIAVWHVDEQGDHNNQNYSHQTSHSNYEVALIQADNQRHLERNSNQGDAQDLFYSGNSASGYSNTFSDSSDASGYDNNAHWWSGANSGLKLSGFSGQGNTMSLIVQTSGGAITGPAGYTWCAGENGSFTLPGTCDVAYGANGSFNYLYGKTGTITFNNATFGDPLSGVAKAGFYKLSQVTLTASAGAGGAISPSGSVKLDQGASQTFTITANAGYLVNTVTVDGASVGAVSSYTFSNVTAAHTISASFSAIPGPAGYTWCAGENGSFTLPGTCDVAYGANGSFNYLYGRTGTITFNNATFGDPLSGIVKSGFYKLSPRFTLTASAGAGGAISPSGSVQVFQGASQSFSITASAGYTVSAVIVDGASLGAVTSYTFSNVQAAHTISASFVVTTPAITITAQPVATAAKVGQTAIFSVAASSNVGVIGYQWYRKLATDTYYSVIAGATSSSCSTPVLALSDQASYFFVRMISGGATQDSVRVPLTVTPVITISTQPAATTVTAGQAATFSVTATANAGTLSYQWYSMRPLLGETVYSAISGATGASLTTSTLAANDNGSYYFVRLTDAGTVVDSIRPQLSVLPAITITADVVAATAKIGQTATFAVAATTTTGSISYQWYRRLATDTYYSAIAGATSASYTTPVLAGGDQASYFFVRLTNGKTVADSTRVPLTVTPLVTISSQPLATSAKIGQTATFSVAASANGGSISYQWYRKLATDTYYSAIAGATGPSLTTTALAANDNGSYYFVRLSDSGTVADSNRVPLTVAP